MILGLTSTLVFHCLRILGVAGFDFDLKASSIYHACEVGSLSVSINAFDR